MSPADADARTRVIAPRAFGLERRLGVNKYHLPPRAVTGARVSSRRDGVARSSLDGRRRVLRRGDSSGRTTTCSRPFAERAPDPDGRARGHRDDSSARPSAAADAAPRPPRRASGLTLAAPARPASAAPLRRRGRPAVGPDLASCATIPRAATTGIASRGGRKERARGAGRSLRFSRRTAPRSSTALRLPAGRREDRAVLDACGITHVINCNAFVIPNYHERPPTSAAADAPPALPLRYKTLWLQDAPGEDVASVLFDCFDFIRDCVDSGGRVLVHCSQGVSRSVSVVVGYLMWRDDEAYERAFARVKEKRGVANPNMGFACQLMQWRRRDERETDPTRHPPPARMYRIAPHSPHDPRYLVAKPVDEERVPRDPLSRTRRRCRREQRREKE